MPEKQKISTHAPRTGSDNKVLKKSQKNANFNPRSPHGERRALTAERIRGVAISTHAPRTGSDSFWQYSISSSDIFQPTLPARGATSRSREPKKRFSFQPTLPARGATDQSRFKICFLVISTHAPRTGSDSSHSGSSSQSADFNPRSPHGERPRPGNTAGRASEFQPTLPARGATCPFRARSPS